MLNLLYMFQNMILESTEKNEAKIYALIWRLINKYQIFQC